MKKCLEDVGRHVINIDGFCRVLLCHRVQKLYLEGRRPCRQNVSMSTEQFVTHDERYIHAVLVLQHPSKIFVQIGWWGWDGEGANLFGAMLPHES
mgnify:CR=1 FL=1